MCELQVRRVEKIIIWFGIVSTIDDYKVFLFTSHIVFYGVLFVLVSS